MIGITEAFNKALHANPGALVGDDGAGLLAELVKKPAQKTAKQTTISVEGQMVANMAVVLANKIVAQEYAEHILLADMQGCAFAEWEIPIIVKQFKAKLDSEGYKGSAQRASDLKIVLLAMLKWGFVSGEGLQASAKQARELAKKMGYIKPRVKKEKTADNGKFLGVFTMPQKDTATPSDSEFLLNLDKAKDYLLAKFNWEANQEAKELFGMLCEVRNRAEKLIEGA